MDIAATLCSYDGKRVAPFRTVADAVRDAPESAVPRLLELAACDDATLQIGATWVVKHLCERGDPPTGDSPARVIDLLGRSQAPDATLHLLQTLQYIAIPARQEEVLRRTLLDLVTSKRAFIRAWAYNGLGLLAARNPALRAEVKALFDRAEKTESAAARVRIRRARTAFSE